MHNLEFTFNLYKINFINNMTRMIEIMQHQASQNNYETIYQSMSAIKIPNTISKLETSRKATWQGRHTDGVITQMGSSHRWGHHTDGSSHRQGRHIDGIITCHTKGEITNVTEQGQNHIESSQVNVFKTLSSLRSSFIKYFNNQISSIFSKSPKPFLVINILHKFP